MTYQRTPRLVLWSLTATISLAAAQTGCSSSEDAEATAAAQHAAPDQAAPDQAAADNPGAEPQAAQPAAADDRQPPLTRSDESEAAAAGILERMSASRLHRDDQGIENVDTITYLAGTRTHDEPSVVLAALSAMHSLYLQRETDRNRVPDETFAQVVLYHIDSPNGAIRQAAIRAAGRAVQSENGFQRDVLLRLIDIARNDPDPAARYEAVEAFGRAQMLASYPDGYAAIIANLEASEPWLVSASLFTLNSGATRRNVPDADALVTRVLQLTTHDDPGVRGRALDLATTMGSMDRGDDRAALIAALMPRLEDEHPFPRSRAFSSAQILRHLPAIHVMIADIGDMTRNTWNIEGWRRLDGNAGRLHHDGSAWSRTGDAAMTTIERLSRHVDGAPQLELPRVESGNSEESLLARVPLVQAWYDANQGSIPRE